MQTQVFTFSFRTILLAAMLIITQSCALDDQTDQHLLTPKEVQSKKENSPQLVIVDVRTPEEYQAGHIEGALLINWNDPSFEQSIAKLDKSQPTVVYCAVGGRSGKAYSKLKQMGFQQVFDMKGGFDAWRKDKLPVAQ